MSKGKSSKIEDLYDPKGEVEVKLDTTVRKLSRDVGTLVADSFYKMSNAESICRDIQYHLNKAGELYEELAQTSKSIGDRFKFVADHNKFEDFNKISDIYSSLFDTFIQQSKVLQDESRSFSHDIQHMFDFSLKELEGFEEVDHSKIQLILKRDLFSSVYKEEKALLTEKKQEAYPSKDLKKWEVDQEKLTIPKLELISDKRLAMRYMFTNDTLDLRNIRDYWGYMNNQTHTQSIEYARLKTKRMNHSISSYVRSVNERINETMSAYIDLTTKIQMNTI